jgi:hypothetical protein
LSPGVLGEQHRKVFFTEEVIIYRGSYLITEEITEEIIIYRGKYYNMSSG